MTRGPRGLTGPVFPWSNVKADITFITLRVKVFEIHQVSATAIAENIRKTSSEREIIELISRLHNYNPDDHPDTPGYATRLLARQEFCEEMDAARKHHAIWLRDNNFRDVKITYTCTVGEVRWYLEDMKAIARMGGSAYHQNKCGLCHDSKYLAMAVRDRPQYPKEGKEQFALCVLISERALNRIFTTKRIESGEIKITTNVRPAKRVAPPVVETTQETEASSAASSISGHSGSTDTIIAGLTELDGIPASISSSRSSAVTMIRVGCPRIYITMEPGEESPIAPEGSVDGSIADEDIPPEMFAGVADLRELDRNMVSGLEQSVAGLAIAPRGVYRARSTSELPACVMTDEEIEENAEAVCSGYGTL